MYSDIIKEMSAINRSDPRRINHALKVFALTLTLAELELSVQSERNTAIIASILHDIGIQECEKKYGSCAGKYQEIEGPPIAKGILEGLGYGQEIIDRVCLLISKHHTYSEILGPDHQILIEADLIVNLEEDKTKKDTVIKTIDKFFKTETGTDILKNMLLSGK